MLSASTFSTESSSDSAYIESAQTIAPIPLPNFDSEQTVSSQTSDASALMNAMMDSFDGAGEDALLPRTTSECDASSGIIEHIDVDGNVNLENGQITESIGASTYSEGASDGDSSSGGDSSGGSSSSAYVTYSGGGDYYDGKYIIPEGRWLTFNSFGVTQGVVVTAGISHGGTSVQDFNLLSGSIIRVIGNTYDISTAADSLMTEEDEAFDVMFNIYVDGILTNTTTFSFLLVERSEFISDADYGVEASYNGDYYRSCISSQASAGNYLMFRPTSVEAVGSLGAIDAYGNSNIYSLVSAQCGAMDVTSSFSINQSNGVITLNAQASELLSSPYCTYSCTLSILVENSKYRYLSGGSAFSDTAIIDLTFSHWDVSRDGEAIANAQPSDGCSIAELAQYVGLKPGEFEEWLTLNNPTDEVELFNRTTKHCSELVAGDILLGTTESLFSVPNTIFAAYCYNPLTIDSDFRWNYNISQLQSLGFKVETFYNSSFQSNEATQAEYTFLSSINRLSNSKQLHGLYLIGHGAPSFFGLLNEATSAWGDNWGPRWTVDYDLNNLKEGITTDNETTWSLAAALRYHLATVIVHACESFSGARSISSKYDGDPNTGTTIVSGYQGNIQPGFYDIVELWNDPTHSYGSSHGGLQGTKRF